VIMISMIVFAACNTDHNGQSFPCNLVFLQRVRSGLSLRAQKSSTIGN